MSKYYTPKIEELLESIIHKYGGGGHRGAAGFRIKNINEIIK